MPTELGPMRVARSFVTPTGASNEVEREIDFQLGQDIGIGLLGVMGYGIIHDDTPAASDTVPAPARAFQTLHLETGATEDLPNVTGLDADDIDTEIFWAQHYAELFQIPATAGGGGGGVHVTGGLGLDTFPRRIDTARNITHKGATGGADIDLECGVLIYYVYLRFSQAELGAILSRR